MNLLVEMKSKGHTFKVWRLRPDQNLHTIGHSRNADLRIQSHEIDGIFAALEFTNGKWIYTQLSQTAVPLTANGDVSLLIEKPTSLTINDIELFMTPVDMKVQIFTENENDGDEKANWVLISAGDIFIESRIIGVNETLVFADQVVTLNSTKQWSETKSGEYTFKHRLVSIPKSEGLSKADRSAFIEQDQEKFLAYTMLIIATFFVVIFLNRPQGIDPKSLTNVKEITTVVLKKPNEKKAPKENAVAKAMSQALPPQSSSGGGAKNVGSVISKIRSNSLSSLIAKVSAQGKRSANVVITTKGESANSQSPTGRAMAVLSKIGTKGTDWKAEGQGSGIGNSVTGIGGKIGSTYGNLNAGAVGSGGVGMIEDESEIVGGLDKEVIANYIKSQLGQILFCYERQLSANPDLFGKVAVKFTISGDGSVETQKIGETSLRNSNVEGCILQRVAKWKFPKPEGGTKVVVTYPFLFKSTN